MAWNSPIDGENRALHEELYDLEQDPDEAINLATVPSRQRQLDVMRSKWALLARTCSVNLRLCSADDIVIAELYYWPFPSARRTRHD